MSDKKSIQFDMENPMVKKCIERLGEESTLELLNKAKEEDHTPVCCLHCPYTDCSYNGTYDMGWLMKCARYANYVNTMRSVGEKKLSLEDRIARLERLFVLAGPFIRVYRPESEIEFRKILKELPGGEDCD